MPFMNEMPKSEEKIPARASVPILTYAQIVQSNGVGPVKQRSLAGFFKRAPNQAESKFPTPVPTATAPKKGTLRTEAAKVAKRKPPT